MTATLLILHCLVAALPEAPQPVGMIENLEGKATIHRAHRQASVVLSKKKFDYYLLEGDRLEIGPGAKVRIHFFRDDHLEDLAPGKFSVGSKTCKGLDAQSKVKRHAAAKFVNPYLESGLATIKRGSGRGAGVLLRSMSRREEGSVSLVSPVTPLRGEMILDDRPRLSWPAAEAATRFQVRMTKAGSGELVWNLETDQTRIGFPKDEPALKRNRSYCWEVRKLLPNGTSERLWTSNFTVGLPVPERELAEINELSESKEPFNLLLAIAAYDELGMSSRALATCQRLAKIASENAYAWRLLSDYYDKAGRLQDAQAAYEKAVELGYVTPPSTAGKNLQPTAKPGIAK